MSFAVYTAGGGCMIDQHASLERCPVPCYFFTTVLPEQWLTAYPSSTLFYRYGMANALVPCSPSDL